MKHSNQVKAPNLVDIYKVSHQEQYPECVAMLQSNITPRDLKYLQRSQWHDGKVVVFGIHQTLDEFYQKWQDWFMLSKEDAVQSWEKYFDKLTIGKKPSAHRIEALYDLGYLPLGFECVKEGVRLPINVPIITIHNTKEGFGWLVNYVETSLLQLIWKPMTVANVAGEFLKTSLEYAKLTVNDGDVKTVAYNQCIDFSARGMSGPEDAMRCGVGHILFHDGSDNAAVAEYVGNVYDDEAYFVSIPATEHAVTTTNIRLNVLRNGYSDIEGETETIKHLITEIYPEGPIGYVADSYDYYGVLTEILPTLKAEIMSRNGTFVIRPDSGNPFKIVCGDKESEVKAERKGSIQLLWELFGGMVNEKGYKVLDSHIRLIYGDGISLEMMNSILSEMKNMGFSSENIYFGIGAFNYQFVTRDTLGFAAKVTFALMEDGTEVDVYKEPATAKSKKSAKGWVDVLVVNGEYILCDSTNHKDFEYEECENGMTTYFKYGHSLTDIINTVRSQTYFN